MFRLFGTPQPIEDSSASLEGALDSEALRKKKAAEEQAKEQVAQEPHG